MWLLTSAFSVCYLMGYNHQLPVIHLDHQGPVLQITGKLTLELVYYAVFSFYHSLLSSAPRLMPTDQAMQLPRRSSP